MTGKRIWIVIFALAVIVVLALGSVALYRLGFAHGAMANITLPEGSDLSMMPYTHHPMGWHYGPRVGLLGLFPLLCFGGFFFLFLIFGLGFMTRKRAWMHHYGPGSHPKHWKHSGSPPWADKQPEEGSESPPQKRANRKDNDLDKPCEGKA